MVPVEEFTLELLEHDDALKVTEDVVLDVFPKACEADGPTRTGHSRSLHPPNGVLECVGYRADNQPMKDKCRCCGQHESIGKDGLCIPCRRDGCWVWEFEPKVGVKA